MVDVHWHASRVEESLRLELPTRLISKDLGGKVVDCVESEFIQSDSIRECSSQRLLEKAKRLVGAIQEQDLLQFTPSEIYIVVLFTWHGCIHMAKCLRPTYVLPGGGEAPYTIEDRWRGYDMIQKCWRVEEDRGNPWVRYGVSLAGAWEIKRGKQPNKDLIEDWVPKDSPYWDC